MKLIQLIVRTSLLIFLIAINITGCAAFEKPEMPSSFSFHMDWDNQHAGVINYALRGKKLDSSGQEVLIDGPSTYNKAAEFHGGDSMTYQYVRPTSLYVKWKDDLTGNVYEDTVDLTKTLPNNLSGTNLYFIIRGPQLYVYLKLNELYREGTPKVGTRFPDKANIQLYPFNKN